MGPSPAGGGTVVPALAAVPLGKAPILLAMAADGTRLYATTDDGRIAIIDTAANRVTAKFDIPVYSTGLAVAPNGERAYATNLFGNTLAVLDASPPALEPSLTLVAQFRRGGYGRLVIAPDGSTAYVVNQDNAAFLLVDLATGRGDVRMMDMRPVDVALSPGGETALICGCKDFCVPGTCVPFDTRSKTFGSYIAVGGRPYRVAIDAAGRRAFVTSLSDPSVAIVDLARGETAAKVSVPLQPTGLAVAPGGSPVYVSSQTMGTLTVVDVDTASVRATAKVASYAREVVLSADGARAYVSTETGVTVVDTATL